MLIFFRKSSYLALTISRSFKARCSTYKISVIAEEACPQCPLTFPCLLQSYSSWQSPFRRLWLAAQIVMKVFPLFSYRVKIDSLLRHPGINVRCTHPFCYWCAGAPLFIGGNTVQKVHYVSLFFVSISRFWLILLSFTLFTSCKFPFHTVRQSHSLNHLAWLHKDANKQYHDKVFAFLQLIDDFLSLIRALDIYKLSLSGCLKVSALVTA